MDWIVFLEHGLSDFVRLIKLFLEATSVACIWLGLIQTLQLSLKFNRSRRRFLAFNELRLCFGGWLALALEFQLGADIAATTLAPSFETLGKLAVLAIIRTFLNFFLTKELEAEMELQQKHSSFEENLL
jgi:uncharacterized membrane protein